jgi:hypothetical protein
MSDDVCYITGLDLGPSQEFTAIAVLERTRVPVPGESDRRENLYAVRHLERLPPGTPFREGNHHGTGNRPIEVGKEIGRSVGVIQCPERLGGLLRYYSRQAA